MEGRGNGSCLLTGAGENDEKGGNVDHGTDNDELAGSRAYKKKNKPTRTPVPKCKDRSDVGVG